MRKLFLFIAATLVSAGMWAGEITVTPPALTNITTTSYGLYTMTHSSTAASSGSKISSGAITTGTKGDVITINFATTKSDLYIKSVTFNSLSNGTIGSDDGSYNTTTGVFTVTGNKTSVNVVLTSADNQKGSVKITNVVINTGDNDVETITFTSFDSSAKTFGFTSSAATSAISSISSNNSNSVSSNILSWSGSRTLVFASSSNKFKYIAFLLNDGKAYTGFSADLGTYSDNYTWIGDTKTITFTNGTGGGRYIKNVYVITEPVPTHTLEWNFAGGTCSAEAGTDYTAGGQVEEGATITYPANNTMSKDGYDFNGWSTSVTTMPTADLTITAQWTEHAVSSDATLSALSLAGYTFKETFAPATTAYTVTLPFYASAPATSAVTATANDANASVGTVTYDSENTKYSVTVTAEDKTTTKTYTITLNWAETPAVSTSINIEQLVLDNGKSYDIGSALTAANIAYVEKDALDSLLIGDSKNKKTDCNEAYLGLKFKKSTSKVTIIVPSGEYLKVKFGAITDGSNLTVSVNGSTAAAPSLTNNVYTLDASEGVKEVVFALGGAKTVVFKQIMVNEVVATVRPFEATVAATTNGTASVDLPKYAKNEEVTVNCVPETGYQLSTITVIGYKDDGSEQEVEVTGNKFTMPGSPVNITVTFSVATALDNTETSAKAVKTLKNGVLIIEKNGKKYNIIGSKIR